MHSQYSSTVFTQPGSSCEWGIMCTFSTPAFGPGFTGDGSAPPPTVAAVAGPASLSSSTDGMQTEASSSLSGRNNAILRWRRWQAAPLSSKRAPQTCQWHKAHTGRGLRACCRGLFHRPRIGLTDLRI